jgi:uncharacterized repeat protein (TIGR03803 family)
MVAVPGKRLWALMLLTACVWIPAPAEAADTILHNFSGSDGSHPLAALILDSAGNLYGTTSDGGAFDRGTIFTVASDGTGFTVLHDFAGGPTDGAVPKAALLLDDAGNLYGTTFSGGAADKGTVFTMQTDGMGFSLLHSFVGGASEGAQPTAALILDAARGILWGTTYGGGQLDAGTVFTMRTDGTNFFTRFIFPTYYCQAWHPDSPLVLDDDGSLYSTSPFADDYENAGLVYKLAQGVACEVLHYFYGYPIDGETPTGGLVLDGAGNLYGNTITGGSRSAGTVFTLKTNGSGFRTLHNFTESPAEGRVPGGGIILDGLGNLYGTTLFGGSSNRGTVFTLATDGSGFTLLDSFVGGPSDGDNPRGVTLDGGGNLYGTTYWGGASINLGVVFRVP